jgi:MFS family permease
MFVVYQVDRSNISEAPSTSTLEDLGLSSSEYGTGRTIYSVCFMLACLPSQLLAKCTGPSTWMSLQVICWSIIACLQSGCSGRWSFWIVRGCLGLLQGGFLPASVLYLSYFYTSKELPLRLAWFWSSYQVTNIFSALLTYGLLHVSSLYNIPGWRWLFAFEGTSGCLIGCLSWLYLPATPTQSTPEFHGKGGWFSVRQEMVAVNRVLRDE